MMSEHSQATVDQTRTAENGHITWDMIVNMLEHSHLDDKTFLASLGNVMQPEAYGPKALYRVTIKQRCAQLARQNEEGFKGDLLPKVRRILGVQTQEWMDDIARQNILHPDDLPAPQSGTSILTTDYPPPLYFVTNMLHHGLILLAGKMKRGKSYLALNMALDISFGRSAFHHLPTKKNRVLYISLEDHAPLIQDRLRKMQPNLTHLPDVEFVYQFPMLGEGALEAMQHYVKVGGFGVIILDTIGRLTPDFGAQRRQMNEYTKITHLLGPVQQWANAERIAVLMIDHVRKAEADDIFDTVMGTSAKMGIADHGIVYQRKDYDNDALLHMRGRWIGDDKIVLTLVDGHLEFLGQGEQYDLSREQRQILRALEDEGMPMKIGDIMATLSVHQGQYGRFKKVLTRMLKDGLVDRTGHGLYCGLKRADYDDSDIEMTPARERYP